MRRLTRSRLRNQWCWQFSCFSHPELYPAPMWLFGRNIIESRKAQVIWKLTFRNGWNVYGFSFSGLRTMQNLVMPKWTAWSLKSIFTQGLAVLPNTTTCHADNTAWCLIRFCYFPDLPLGQLTNMFKNINYCLSLMFWLAVNFRI